MYVHNTQKNKVHILGIISENAAVMPLESYKKRWCLCLADTAVYNLAKYVCIFGIVDLVQKRQ